MPITLLAENYNTNFFGTYLLNKSGDYDEGILKITDCKGQKCYFELQSSQNMHTCEAEGVINMTDEGKAEYTTKDYRYDKKNKKEFFVDVGIVFQKDTNKEMVLKYTNSQSYNAFCGMSATLEGIWTKVD